MNTARQSARQYTLDELRRLLAEATPGPWFTYEWDVWASDAHGEEFVVYSNPHTKPDADLIVAAVNALPALLRVAEAAQHQRDMSGAEPQLIAALAALEPDHD